MTAVSAQTAGAPPGADTVAAPAVADPPLLEPVFSVTLEGPVVLRGLTVHPDNTRAFAHVIEPGLDLWPVAVHYWPEIVGGLAVLLALPAVWVIWRRARRPRRVGRVYCRRCDYELGESGANAKSKERETNIQAETGAEAAGPARCPECGLETAARRPIDGCAMRQRLAMPLAWALLVSAGYGALLVWGPARDGAFAERFFLPSKSLRRQAEQRGWTVPAAWACRIERLVVVNLVRGRSTGTLVRMPGPSSFEALLASDGASLYIQDRASGGLRAIDARTGATRWVDTMPAADHPDRYDAFRFVPPGEGVQPGTVSRGRNNPERNRALLNSRVWQAAGLRQHLAALEDAPSFGQRVLTPLPSGSGAEWLLLSAADPLRPGPAERGQTFDGAGQPVSAFDITAVEHTTLATVLAAPEPALVLAVARSPALRRIALPSGTESAPIPLPVTDDLVRVLAASPAGSRMLVCLNRQGWWLFDAASDRWIARLAMPAFGDYKIARLSPDGRFVVAPVSRERTPGSRIGSAGNDTVLLIWDLSRLDPAAGASAGREPEAGN